MYYRIQKRKHSSNILERSTDKKHWDAFIAPLVKKDEGDAICQKLFNDYSKACTCANTTSLHHKNRHNTVCTVCDGIILFKYVNNEIV